MGIYDRIHVGEQHRRASMVLTVYLGSQTDTKERKVSFYIEIGAVKEKNRLLQQEMHNEGKPLFEEVAWKLTPKEQTGARFLAENGEVS